ncbi:helix-turn-helix domain-containing protein [Kurthia sibirica]
MVGQAFVELVETLRGQISVRRICELMGVARATYYRWKKQKGT